MLVTKPSAGNGVLALLAVFLTFAAPPSADAVSLIQDNSRVRISGTVTAWSAAGAAFRAAAGGVFDFVNGELRFLSFEFGDNFQALNPNYRIDGNNLDAAISNLVLDGAFRNRNGDVVISGPDANVGQLHQNLSVAGTSYSQSVPVSLAVHSGWGGSLIAGRHFSGGDARDAIVFWLTRPGGMPWPRLNLSYNSLDFTGRVISVTPLPRPSVPEPASGVLAAIAASGLYARKRKAILR